MSKTLDQIAALNFTSPRHGQVLLCHRRSVAAWTRAGCASEFLSHPARSRFHFPSGAVSG